MTDNHAKGLMAFWSDIDDDYLQRFQQWHNCEHVPERVSIPGFLRGRRYRAEDGRPHFLMMYETLTSKALASEAYLAALDAPTPWTREALTHFRNPSRNIYQKAASAGSSGPFCATWITALRFNLLNELDGPTALAWLDAMASQPGVGRVQLWCVDEAASGIKTAERHIYSGGPGEQQFLLLIEASAARPVKASVLEAADAAVPKAKERQHEILARYWLEIFHNAPNNQEAQYNEIGEVWPAR